MAAVPDPADGLGIGVFGTSGKGAGVRGSSERGEGGQFESESGVGATGTSDSGAGVSGTSAKNRGGLFSSAETVAQIRLVPHQQRPKTPVAALPTNGSVGDLIVIRTTGTDPEGVSFDYCSLWLCTPKEPFQEESDQWTEVLLGGTVTGTL